MTVKTCRLLTLGALLAILTFSASPASAETRSPWWHLTSGSRPTNLHSGFATNEVQEIDVRATGGNVVVIEPVSLEEFFSGKIELSELKKAEFAYNATHEVAQVALEGLYGSGNVEVGNGSGGGASYVVTFKGTLRGQLVKLMNTEFSLPLGGLEGEAITTQVTEGRPDGEIIVTASNLGDAEMSGSTVPVQIADTLPPGLKALSIRATAYTSSANVGLPLECSLGSPLICRYGGSLPPYDLIEVHIPVLAEQDAETGEENEVSVSGGEAPTASIARPITVSEKTAPFGVESYELTNEEIGGASDTQAGSHPFQQTTTLTFNSASAGANAVSPAALVKDLRFKWPPGLIGNPVPFQHCTLAQFLKSACPPQSVVGVAHVTIDEPKSVGIANFPVPLYNLEPSVGEAARFAFIVENNPVYIDVSLRTGEDYGITVHVYNVPQAIVFLSSEVTVWGVPGDPRHDSVRGEGCLREAHGVPDHAPCHPLEEKDPPAFLSLPTACTGTLQTSLESDSWAQPGVFTPPVGEPMPPLGGCNRLPFSPEIKVAPDGQRASTPSGLTVDVHVPQEESLNPHGLAESDPKDITVALPAGLTINPAGADGLEACGEAQMGFTGFKELNSVSEAGVNTAQFTPSLPSCPDASKIATVKIKTPNLPDPLEGAVYLAAQNANPFGSLVAMYIVAEDPVSGVLVKLPGEVSLDQLTGQLTATFPNSPQAPFEDAELHFFGGERAPLATPPHCGAYTTSTSIAPWSGQDPSHPSSTFDITSGPNGGPCSDPLPFSPSLTAGTTSIQAGGFSPFTMTMSRPDGSQNLQAIQLHMPPGLSGLLSGVKLCPEAQANAGTCGPESQIGETIVSVGLGGSPFSVTGGKVYITEGYEGAPYGLSVVNPAKAGPYDLGQVVVRAKIEVDPITAALTITSDNTGLYKIPTILDGIPLQIKHVNVTINRPRFTFNPTNCNPMQITGSLSSAEGSTSALSVPLQVTNCAALGFKPGFRVSTAGKTSRANGASLSVKLTYPKAPFGSQANIAKVKVDLPKQLPSRLTTLQKACPDSTFNKNPALCSPESRVGRASATTPLLPVPLTGPAYFVSHGGAKFPELIVVLSGYGTTIDLHGETFINPAGITSSTFRTVPDAPVGTFELILPQGPNSALAANGNLCKSTLKMPTAFTAQNGAQIKQSTPISVTGCVKHKTRKKAGRTSRRHKGNAHRKR